ncbi:MAG TPA: hypothetical protein VGH63_19060, partial [Polyangia bacterium]
MIDGVHRATLRKKRMRQVGGVAASSVEERHRSRSEGIHGAADAEVVRRLFLVGADGGAVEQQLGVGQLHRMQMGRHRQVRGERLVAVDELTQIERGQIVGVDYEQCRYVVGDERRGTDRAERRRLLDDAKSRSCHLGEQRAATAHKITDRRRRRGDGDSDVGDPCPEEGVQVPFEQRDAADGNERFGSRRARALHALALAARHDESAHAPRGAHGTRTSKTKRRTGCGPSARNP